MKKHLVALLSMMGLASTIAPLRSDALKTANDDSKTKTEGKVKLDKQNAEKNAAAAQSTQKSSIKMNKVDSEDKWHKADSEKKAVKSDQEIKGEKNAATIKGEKANAVIKVEKSNAAIKGEKTNAEMKESKNAITVKQKTAEKGVQQSPK